MTDWTAGYVADIGYTFGYYPELNPLRVQLAFASAGVVCPAIETACELGFGQGLSINLHAAASSVQWHGTDFNPAQAAFARELGAASGADVHLRDDAFADFVRCDELPDFDFIGLHGVWSWISDENRRCIVDFVHRKLKVGGVLYVGYNTLPGWSAFAPMRHLLTLHAEVMGVGGAGISRRIDGALAFADALLEADPAYARAHPTVRERLGFMHAQSRQYLAHEFFNRDWHPMHFSTMAEWLAPARLGYVCQANLLEHVDALNLTEAQRAFLQDIPDAALRESARDFIVNQGFRRDYWVKGLRRQGTAQQGETLRRQRVMLASRRADVPTTVKSTVGDVTINDAPAVLDLLADQRPHALAEVQQRASLTLGRTLVCVNMLAGMGHVVPVYDEQRATAARRSSDALNAHLARQAAALGDVGHLASPLTGGGFPVSRVSQLFVASLASGLTQPAEWAQDAWKSLSAQDSQLIKNGRPIESAEDNLAELNGAAAQFAERELPLLRAVGIA